jgi:haloalkane dehalogenase
MSYIDTSSIPNCNLPTALFLHGNPTSSYLWRNVIPHVSPIARCIAPDLPGFGSSGKMPSNSYRIVDHTAYLAAFISAVIPAPQKIVLVIHDWGSALGFDWARQNPDRVAGLAFMEFIYPMPSWNDFHEGARAIFQAFRGPEGRKLVIDDNVFIEQLLFSAVQRGFTEEEKTAYRAPFLDPKDREPIYRFPNEIPIDGQPKDVYEMAEKYHEWLLESEVQKLMLWVEPGALIGEERRRFYEKHLKNCRSVGVGDGGHYLQEDQPGAIGREVKGFVEGLKG